MEIPVAQFSQQKHSSGAHLLNVCVYGRSVLGILHIQEGCQLKCLHQGGQDPLSIILTRLKPLLGPAQPRLQLTSCMKRCKASRCTCHAYTF